MLVCLDVVDPSCVFRIGRINAMAHNAGQDDLVPISLVFVPSLNPGDNPMIEEGCRNLSRLANCMVFYTDYRNSCEENHCFLWGYKLPDEIEQIENLPHSPIVSNFYTREEDGLDGVVRHRIRTAELQVELTNYQDRAMSERHRRLLDLDDAVRKTIDF